MSGTIYIKIDPEIVIEKIKNKEIDLTERLPTRDRRILAKNESIRQIILDQNIHRDLQQTMFHTNKFTIDEAMRVIRSSDRIIDSLSNYRNYEYPAEFLIEFGYKLDLYNIENQPNITPEFVEKYGDKMDLSTFIEVRSEKGDAEQFKSLGIVRLMDIPKNEFNYTMSPMEMVNKFRRYKSITEEEAEKIIKTTSELYSIKITKDYIRELYDTGQGNHSTYDIMSYWDNHYHPSNIEFENWDAFVRYSRNNGCSALPDVMFDAFYRSKIMKSII